jgi:hypothetical protein
MKVFVAILIAPTAALGAPSPSDAPTPAETAPSAEDPLPVRGYLGGGGAVGVISHFGYGAVTVDGGARLGESPWWLRGQLGFGSGQQLGIFDQTADSGYQAARVGAELRVGGDVRFIAGVDVGVDHIAYRAVAAGLADTMVDITEGAVIPRLGVELGGAGFMLRPTVEAGVTTRGKATAALTLAAGYRF